MNVWYQEGYDAGDPMISPFGIRPCPYKKNTYPYTEWWRGFCDSTRLWYMNICVEFCIPELW